MYKQITANQLKTKGASVLKDSAAELEAFISVRGENKYVVMPLDRYNILREYELTAALEEARQDVREGKFHKDSVDDHLERISK